MRTIAAALALIFTLPLFGATTRTNQIIINCITRSRLSAAGQTIIYKDCDDGKNYVSKDGGAFAELATVIPSPTAAGVSVTNSGAESLANDTTVTLTWDTEDRDDDTFHSTVTNTDRLTTDTAGWVIAIGIVHFTGSGTGIRQCWIKKNGTDTVTSAIQQPISGSSVTVPCIALVYLSTTDYLTLQGYQNSGGTLTTSTHTSFRLVRF